jgi:hypothetical protein
MTTSDSATDPGRIDEVLVELARVWKRNPRRTLLHIVTKAAEFTPSFVPDDITDAELLAGLRSIAPGLPAPE